MLFDELNDCRFTSTLGMHITKVLVIGTNDCVISLHVHSQNPNCLCHPQCPSLDPGVILLSGLKFKRGFCELEVQAIEIHELDSPEIRSNSS
jgi:hypothetical protein